MVKFVSCVKLMLVKAQTRQKESYYVDPVLKKLLRFWICSVLIDTCGRALSSVFSHEYICHKCQNCVEALPTLLKKAKDEKDEIIQFIVKKLPPTRPTIGRKRSIEQREGCGQSGSSSKRVAVGDTSPTRTPERSLQTTPTSNQKDIKVYKNVVMND